MLSEFKCVRCGNCCRWPGAVRVSEQEIAAIADFLNIPFSQFMADYVALTSDRKGLTLLEKVDGSCMYLTSEGCMIQDVKPVQCVQFPYKWNFPGWENECEGARRRK